MQPDSCVEFPPFRLDLANHEIWRGGERLPLRPKPFAVLAYLATHAKRLVPHAELVRAVWPDTHVADGLLRGYVRDIRTVLKDDPAEPRFIETVARLGYRFVAPVRPADRLQSVDVAVEADRLPTGLVGRAAQLRALERRLALALGGERQIVFVTGEPGIGKTTLVDAFVALAARGRDVWTARGQCVEHFGASEAYLPVLEALGRLGPQPGGEEVVAILSRHAPTWLVQLPALVPDAELDTVQRRVQGATRERMLRELAEALEVVTAVRPLVLVLEDVQWSDDSTLDLLSSVARRRGTARLLVLCTYRPADVAANARPLGAITRELQLHGHCVEIALPSLDVGEVHAYLAGRLASPALAPDLARPVHAATDGNPLYVVSLVDHWIAHGVLAEHDGRWTLDARPAETGVPDTLRQLIERQLDRVSPDEGRVVEAASVVGRDFSTAAVAAALAQPEERVDESCERLATRGLFLQTRGLATLPDGAVAGRYAFLHALHRQVLYERLAPTRRVRLHRRIGEWGERTYGARVRDHAAEVALHFERGHDVRAVAHLEAAAKNAVDRHAYGEATALFGRALDLLAAAADGPARRRQELSLQMGLGTSLLVSRGYAAPEVEHAFARARELARDMPGDPELVFALAGLFRFYFARAQFRPARELGDQVLGFAQAHDHSLLAIAHTMVGCPRLSVADLVAAREHLEQAVARYDVERHGSIGMQHGDDPALTSLAFLAMALWFLGYPDQALERARQGEALAERLGAPYGVAFARGFLAWTHVRRGDVALARRCSEALMALATEQGFGFFVAEASIFRGWALAEQGEVEAGIEQIREGLASHRGAGLEMGRPSHLALLAEACARGSRYDEGLAVLDEAIATVRDTGERAYEAEVYRLQGDVLRLQAERGGRKAGLDARAHDAVRRAIGIARGQGAKSLELRAVLASCRLRSSPRERAQARRALGEVYGWFGEGRDTADVQAAAAMLARSR